MSTSSRSASSATVAGLRMHCMGSNDGRDSSFLDCHRAHAASRSGLGACTLVPTRLSIWPRPLTISASPRNAWTALAASSAQRDSSTREGSFKYRPEPGSKSLGYRDNPLNPSLLKGRLVQARILDGPFSGPIHVDLGRSCGSCGDGGDGPDTDDGRTASQCVLAGSQDC